MQYDAVRFLMTMIRSKSLRNNVAQFHDVVFERTGARGTRAWVPVTSNTTIRKTVAQVHDVFGAGIVLRNGVRDTMRSGARKKNTRAPLMNNGADRT